MTSQHDRDSTPAPRPENPGGAIDDAELGRLVRAVADDWSMPAVRLDQPGWRDGVRSPRARRLAAFRGWTGRMGQAAAGAVALTVGAALLGVWLTRPSGSAGQSPQPTGTDGLVTSPGPGTTGPTASKLPKLLVAGDIPTPSELIVKVESAFAIVDLGSGTIGQEIASGQWGTDVRRAPNGSIYCLCLGGDGYASGSFTHMTVAWNRYDDAGTVAESVTIGEYTGAPDLRDAGNPEQSQHVALHVSYSADPRLAFVGWSLHAHPIWKSGVVVVDVSSGAVVQRIDLPDRLDGTETTRIGVDAPRIIGSIGEGRLAVTRPWYSWSPPTGSNPSFRTAADIYGAAFDGDRLSSLEALPAASGCADAVTLTGARAGGGYWLACTGNQYSRTILRRVAMDGRVIGETDVIGAGDLGGDTSATTAVSPDGTAIFLWNPTTRVLTRVDLTTGEASTGTGDVTADAGGPLGALGRWLTPAAAAKVLLSSGIAISPDGTRIYALGIESNVTAANGDPGSAGVFIFDTANLRQLAHWEATADFVSLAVSADARFVYAAGSPQFNVGGTVTGQEASITVFDARDGSVRLIAGQLGRGFLLFPSTIVQ